MKQTKIIKIIGIGAMSLLLTMISYFGYSQACSGNLVNVTTSNVTTGANFVEFDVNIQNTGTTTLRLSALTVGVNLVPTGVGTLTQMMNGATGGTVSIINQPSASDFGNTIANGGVGNNNLGAQQFQNVAAQKQIRSNGTLTSAVTGATADNLPPNVVKKWSRLRLTLTGANFPANFPINLVISTSTANGGSQSQANVYCNGNTTSATALTHTTTPAATMTASSTGVTLNPQASGPTASVLSGTTSICAGGSTNLSVAITGGTGPYTVVINPGNITVNNYASGSPISVTPGATTTYTLTSVTDAGSNAGTGNTGNPTVTVNALPTVTAGNVSGCAGSSISLVGAPAGGTFSVANPYTGPTTTYTYSYTDGNGCSATSTAANITVNAAPTVTAGNVSGCAGSSISLVGAPAGGTFSAANPYTGPSTTYTYTYTDGNGCTATSASASITTNALPTVTAGSVSGCAGSAIALAGLPAGAGGSYSVSNPYTGPSTTYTYTYTDGNGCTNTSSAAAITAINCASCQLVVDYNSLLVSPISYTTATVSWAAVPTAVSYKIQYRTVGSSVWNGQTVVANSTNIIGLAMGTAYEVQIRANCVTGSGTYTPSKLFSTLANPCGMPTTLTATGMTATTALLSWSNTGATSYSVRVRVVGSPWAGATATGTPTNSFTATGLMPGTNYEFQVIGNCAGIFSAWSTQVGTFTTTGTPCLAPSGLNATAVTMTGATLNWSNTGATSYSFGFRIVGSPTWGSSSISLTNSKSITGLVANTNYEFRVTSNCNGVFSPWSPVVGTFNTGSLMKPIFGSVESTSSEVSVYPNPTKDKLNIEFTAAVSEDAMVKVMDMTGRVVKVIRASVEAGNNTIEVSLSEFSAGMYTIQLFENNSLTHVGKVQKQD